MKDPKGTRHWHAQRGTAVLLVPLSLWFAFSMASLAGAGHAGAHAWLARPVNGLFTSVFALILFRHAHLGIEEVILDYVHAPCVKHGSLIAVRVIAGLLAAAAVISVAVIMTGGRA